MLEINLNIIENKSEIIITILNKYFFKKKK